tara:strand:+ start:758 stop:1201 length:444 start_codon:yes stop_codon:yes gene_type:complete
MSFYTVGGCRYSVNHRWISQPLSSSPHGGIFNKIPKYYQDYQDEITRRRREREAAEEQEQDKRANDFFKRFFGFYGFDSEEKEPEKINPDYPYNVFGLKKSASNDDMKKAYRKSILKEHPDRGGTNEGFRRIQEAWEYFKSFISSSV